LHFGAIYRQTSGLGVYRSYLIASFDVPVWQLVKLGLYHSRDIIGTGADVPPFAPSFGQTLGPVGNNATFVVRSGRSMTGTPPVILASRDWATADLINVLLVNPGYIDRNQWKDILVEVSIHHRQTVSLMVDDGSGDRSYDLDTFSRFGRDRTEILPGQPQPSATTLFPSDYDDFSVDFIWHMNGIEFFRIMDLPVRITV
jgi:hypothetical protein